MVKDPEGSKKADAKKNWKYRTLDSGTVMLTKYIGKEKDVEVPARIGKKKAIISNMEYGTNPFKNNNKIRSVSFEKGFDLQYLPDNFCEGCTNLKKVTLPSGLRVIQSGAFKGCKSLKILTLPDSLQTIEFKTSGSGDWNPAFAKSGIKEFRIRYPSTFYTKDGVLYHSFEESMAAYPPQKKDSTFRVPSSIRSIDCMFLNSYVKKVRAPRSCMVSNAGKVKRNRETGKTITGRKIKVSYY